MIVICHQNNRVVSIEIDGVPYVPNTMHIARQLLLLAERYPKTLLVWCLVSCKNAINWEVFSEVFHHKKIMASYGQGNFLPAAIGYVEDSSFIKINKEVSYPTWQMHTAVGGIHTSVIQCLATQLKPANNFGYFLNALAKKAMPEGLLCYSEPRLYKNPKTAPVQKPVSLKVLFRFVKQQYKTRWVFLLFLNLMLQEKKVPLWSLIGSLFVRQTKWKRHLLDAIPIQSTKTIPAVFEVDVVIPTIGREAYLHDVLDDLAVQTLLPEKVIIVEQNPDIQATTALPFLTEKEWPFTIEHYFIHQTGACNARNMALDAVTAPWVFLADDDIRMEADVLERAMQQLRSTASEAITIACLQKEEKPFFLKTIQWSTFGSGCSFLSKNAFADIRFDRHFEHGYGEDGDFGMQLRNKGIDILYVPAPSIVHLKAPVGGFRTKPVLAWHNEPIPPKPAPSVFLFYLKHRTPQQLAGYKLILFFKYYKKQSQKNWWRYYHTFQKQWQVSRYWAEKGRPTNEKPPAR